MTTLRETILKKLTGTTSQTPVRLDALRAIAEPICNDMGELYKLLDQLYIDKTIQRASGYKDSKPFVSYWITGSIQATAPFRISTPAPLVRKVATPEQAAAKMQQTAAKVQPNTSISPTPFIQEKPMAAASELRTTIYNMIVKKPGIKKDDLIEYALVECPESTKDQAKKTIGNLLHAAKTIRAEGTKGDQALYPTDGAVKAPPQAAAAKAPSPAKQKPAKKPTALPAPVIPNRKPTAFDPEFSFAFGVRKDGGVAICKDGISVVLARSEVQTILAHTTQE